MPGTRYRDLCEGARMLSRATRPLGSSFNLATVEERVEAMDENPPRAVDRQSAP
jgi:hypothetical protein